VKLEETKTYPEYPKLRVDSLPDIASNKLLALFSRATLRDFLDVYFVIEKRKFTQEELIEKAKIKDPGFDLYWFGIALEKINTFDENSPEMFLLLEPINFKKFVDFFNLWRKEIILLKFLITLFVVKFIL
jgi:hypothetical protein